MWYEEADGCIWGDQDFRHPHTMTEMRQPGKPMWAGNATLFLKPNCEVVISGTRPIETVHRRPDFIGMPRAIYPSAAEMRMPCTVFFSILIKKG